MQIPHDVVTFYWDVILVRVASIVADGFGCIGHGLYALAAGIALSGYFRRTK